MTDHYVVMFSGGKGSWAAARVLVESGVSPSDMTLLFTDTNGEHPDLYRFLTEAAEDIGAELVWIDNDGQTIWDVFRKARMIGNTRLSVCSRILKQKPARDWLDANRDPETTKVVVGIDWTESHRLAAISFNYQPFQVVAPLTEPGAWSKDRVDAELAKAGIEQPALYAMGFPHNNCAGACVRGGQGQWVNLLETNPERYAQEEAEEQRFRDETGKDVAILRDRRGGTTKPLTLTALRHRVEGHEEVDRDDIGGCGCMTDLATDDEVAAIVGASVQTLTTKIPGPEASEPAAEPDNTAEPGPSPHRNSPVKGTS
jgi:3'-phosphoadenosine 5'-phosphosulfate sulfotransferase (PAPS reductase)/FAD synthetase